MKTIKQIADELEVDKQRVYRYIKKTHITEAHQESGVMYYDEAAESRIKQGFYKNEAHQEAHQKAHQKAIIDVLLKQSEMLKSELAAKDKQIEAKDKQIEALNNNLATALKAADQAQQLQGIAEQKLKLLEQKEDETQQSVEEATTVKRNIFNFWKSNAK